MTHLPPTNTPGDDIRINKSEANVTHTIKTTRSGAHTTLHAAPTHITQTHTDKTQNTTTLVTHHRQNKHSSTGTHATGTPQHHSTAGLARK